MAHRKDKQIEKRIVRLLELAKESKSEELQSELACYIAVMCSGWIEECCRTLLLRYCEKKSNREVQRFVATQLRFFQNPRVTKIQELFGWFDKSFSMAIEQSLEASENAAIDSVVSNKNSLAHGQNSGLSLDVASRYFALVRSGLQKIEAVLPAK